MLFIAGLDTVVNAMSFGVRGLALNAGLQSALREDPTLIPKVMEELLRRSGRFYKGLIKRADARFDQHLETQT